MSNLLAIKSDRTAVMTPALIAVQHDDLTPLTVTFDTLARALFGAGAQFHIHFQRSDGTTAYVGPYAVAASVAITIPDAVLTKEGTLRYTVRVEDDAGYTWHTLEGYTCVPRAIESVTPATATDRVYVEAPASFVAGNIPSYNPTTGKLTDTGTPFPISTKTKQTADGGTAILLKNRTGAPSVKGYVVRASPTYDNAVALIVKDQPDPIGVFLEDGVADGSDAWIVTGGIGDVYFVGNTVHGQLARGFLTQDGASYVIGQAMAENVPSSPFASDKHFFECGHVLESRTGAGLAKCVLHFN